MSKTLDQIFIANPITTNASTDLMYFAQSPYTPGKDAGMTFANFEAQFPPLNGVVLLAPSGNQTITLHDLFLTGGSIAVTSGTFESGSTAGGVEGQITLFPNTTVTGSFVITSKDNTSNFVNTLQNASTTGARTWTLPDASGTISLTSQVLQWIPLASTPITAVINTGYYVTDASQVTITLPVTAAAGSIIGIVGYGAGGWIIHPGAGQTIYILNKTTTVSVASSSNCDAIELLCTVANTSWVARSVVSNGLVLG